MIIKQLSIFLQNRIGRFAEICGVLGNADINMSAFTVSENSDFGILRLIVDDTDRALQVLREQSIAVSTTDVVLFKCADKPGAMALYMEKLTKAGVFIEYMYAFSSGEDRAVIVVRSSDSQRCEEVLNS